MKNLKLVVPILMVLTLAVIPFMGACDKTPAETIELTFATLHTPEDSVGQASLLWMEKIEEETNGQVKFTAYWGGTLINPRETYAEISTGVYDVGSILSQFAIAGTFPVQDAMAFFFHGCPDMETGIRVFREVYEKYPEARTEYSLVKCLGYFPGDFYDLYTAQKPVRSLADVVGMIVRKGGLAMDTVTGLGAEGVNISTPDTILGLQKGTLDGTFVNATPLKVTGLAEVVKYRTIFNYYTGPHVDLAMSIDKWNSLPRDVQKVFEDNIDFYTSGFMDVTVESIQEGLDYAEEMNVEFVELSSEDSEEFNDLAATSAAALAAELDAKGLPGTQIYQDVQELIAKYSK